MQRHTHHQNQSTFTQQYAHQSQQHVLQQHQQVEQQYVQQQHVQQQNVQQQHVQQKGYQFALTQPEEDLFDFKIGRWKCRFSKYVDCKKVLCTVLLAMTTREIFNYLNTKFKKRNTCILPLKDG